ncbi:hypothetical protein ABL78_0384 [Leptomonas seymouri]|uniref:ABC3 transporter permease C-terminal domain-containing protein n=1 Tax=Leptomonas seymouri TaxID=5684 RepID=A0A0N1PEK2_LEPSE|nr:hypothetical protein ABL78_0384 [Leptomonas seymouri]|eukprot:KPI90454.1 hypothetical protein ABL78_0384 [Leptomonas seymouri]
MRATTVLSEGFLQRPRKRHLRANAFAYCKDIADAPLTYGFAPATEVAACTLDAEPVEASVARKSLPLHPRARIDSIEDDDCTWMTWIREGKEGFSQVFGSTACFRLMLDLTISDATSRQGSYALSFCSVCSVVCVCVVMITVLSSFAVVGLRLAEDTYGAVDLEMTAGGFAASAVSLNYTHVSDRLKTLSLAHQLHSYRVELAGTARKQSSCKLQDGTVQSLWLKPTDGYEMSASNSAHVLCQETCVSAYCVGNAEKVSMIAVDPSRDPAFTASSAAHVGTVLRDLPYGSVMVSESLADALLAETGDLILINAIINPDLRHVFQHVVDYEVANPHILLSVKVGAVINDAYFPASSKAFILFNPLHFTSLVVDAMAPSVPTEARAVARLVKPADYATRILFQMPAKERMAAYLQSDFVQIRSHVRDWGSLITQRIGAHQITMATPILSFLYRMQFFTSFVGLIISIIVLALSIVSTILIHTLLTIGFETTTYKLGIYRMLGFSRSHLVMLVFTNTYFFALPAWIFGLITGLIGYWIVRALILHYAAVPLGLGVSGSAVGWATLAGLGVPFIASLIPLCSLIFMSLPDALNTSRGRGTGVFYRVERGGSRHLAFQCFGIGFLGAVSGFTVYYLFPISFVTMNYYLMFFIFFLILLGMLGGLVLLTNNFERVIETMLQYVLMFWEPVAVRSMVSKSLAAHRRRNQQTTMMYALSVGFLVFITVAFDIGLTSLRYSRERSQGADVTLYLSKAERPKLARTPAYAQTVTTLQNGTTYVYEATRLHPGKLLGMTGDDRGFYFADYVQLEHDIYTGLGETVVQAMTYRVASPKGGNLFPVREIRMKTFGRRAVYTLSVCPVPPNFYDVVKGRFVKVNKYGTEVGRYGLTGGLYAESPTNAAVIATTTNRVFALRNFTDKFLFETNVAAFSRGVNNSDMTLTAPKNKVMLSAGRAVAVMDSSAVFLMTKFPNNMGEVLISLPSAVRLTGVPYLSCNVLSLAAVFLRVSSPAHHAQVKAFLLHWLSDRWLGYQVSNLASAFDDLETVDTIFTVFFMVTQVVMMLVCFFSLMSSMTANVLDSSKEIGVLLCLGMSHMQVYRVYVWEAFILVVSSGFLGVLVGTALAVTMMLQNSLFTQLLIPFPFPYTQLCIILVMGLGSALAASISPVKYLLSLRSISHILRRVV